MNIIYYYMYKYDIYYGIIYYNLLLKWEKQYYEDEESK